MTQEGKGGADDRDKFEQHPDVRGLAGPGEGEGGYHAFGESEAANAELLDASEVLVVLSEVPLGATLRVRHLAEDGVTELDTRFVRTRIEAGGPNWVVSRTLPDGRTFEEPATIDGARLPQSLMIRVDAVLRGAGLNYLVTHSERVRSGEELSELAEAKWRNLPPVDGAPEDMVGPYLEIGLLVDTPEGRFWNVPLSQEEVTTGSVTRAEVILPGAVQEQ